MVFSLPGSSIHGIFQARVLEWVATAFSMNQVYLPLKPRLLQHLNESQHWTNYNGNRKAVLQGPQTYSSWTQTGTRKISIVCPESGLEECLENFDAISKASNIFPCWRISRVNRQPNHRFLELWALKPKSPRKELSSWLLLPAVSGKLLPNAGHPLSTWQELCHSLLFCLLQKFLRTHPSCSNGC